MLKTDEQRGKEKTGLKKTKEPLAQVKARTASSGGIPLVEVWLNSFKFGILIMEFGGEKIKGAAHSSHQIRLCPVH